MNKIGSFPFTVVKSASDGPGFIEGYASVYDVVDLQDEIVERGAVTRTIKALTNSGRRLPLTAEHSTKPDDVIGSADLVREDASGMWTKFRFATDRRSQDLRTKAVEGHLNGLSIFGNIVRSTMRMVEGRPVRVLKDVNLMAVGLTPFPVNGLSVGVAKAADYSPDEWRRACLIDTDAGDVVSKSRYVLPVKDPGGTISRSGVHAAAAALDNVDVPDGQKIAVAKTLVRIYRADLNEDPPESLLQTAGMPVASLDFDGFTIAMKSALAIAHRPAMKAAVDELLAGYDVDADKDVTPEHWQDAVGVSEDDPDSSQDHYDAAKYALSVIGETEPIDFAERVVASVELAQQNSDLDALAASIEKELA